MAKKSFPPEGSQLKCELHLAFLLVMVPETGTKSEHSLLSSSDIKAAQFGISASEHAEEALGSPQAGETAYPLLHIHGSEVHAVDVYYREVILTVHTFPEDIAR